MPVGSESLSAGCYTAVWNSVTLGLFEGDQSVPALEHMVKGEDVANTSAYAKMTIDTIYQGADWFASMVCVEWRAGVRSAFWPYSGTLGTAGVIGRFLYDLSAPLVLTVVTGTPAATTGPTTITANKAILAPGFAPRILFGPTLRKVPLRFRLYPYLDGGSNVVHLVTG